MRPAIQGRTHFRFVIGHTSASERSVDVVAPFSFYQIHGG